VSADLGRGARDLGHSGAREASRSAAVAGFPRCPAPLDEVALCLLFLLVAVPFVCGFGPVALVESDAARAPVTEATARKIAQSTPPTIKARGAILEDGSTGQVLWEKDADRQLPMASIAKTMTAVVALGRLQPDAVIPMQVPPSQLVGLSVAGIRNGERLSLREMLFGMMLPSGADAALAIAQAAAGSPEQFVALMNQRSAALGMTSTHWVNVHGDDAPGQVSTARDLARLGRIALDIPVLAEVVATKEHSVRGLAVTYTWRNTNDLLFIRPDATGIKTGTTPAAGDTLLASAQQGQRRAVVVVLNSPDRWGESGALFDHYFEHFALVRAELPPSPFYRGLKLPTNTASETVPAWQVGLLSVRIELAEAGAMASWELAGRPFGQPASVGP
jgi:D-alanyl-D-alanine carboxypeptidase (penicillin-binding protein 5/6)